MKRQRNGVNKGFENAYEQLYNKGLSNPDNEVPLGLITHKNQVLTAFAAFCKKIGDGSISCVFFLKSYVTKPPLPEII